jgi:MCP family monocarboxylic acid transporter-like MFS transporter 14
MNERIFSLVYCISAMAVSNFCTTYTTQAIFCAVFGITSGAYVGLTSVVLVDLLGLDNLTNAFGLLLLFQGIASVMGPPFIGKN